MRLSAWIMSGLVALSAATLAPVASAQEFRPWMHGDVRRAWSSGWRGQNVRVTVVDDYFNRGSGRCINGQLRAAAECQSHGAWTARQVAMIAPRATVARLDWANGAVRLDRTRLNVLNLSYGMLNRPGLGRIGWNAQNASVIAAARAGTAVVVKSAGNNGVNIDSSFLSNGQRVVDYLSRDLVGLRGTIFVGALSSNGLVARPAVLASYSNRAGNNRRIQDQFLVVGVPSDKHGLAGTSFAAPVVAGYAAIVGSKFPRAKPEAIARQLLTTARTDTIRGYRRNIHGRGEASLSRALAPRSIR